MAATSSMPERRVRASRNSCRQSQKWRCDFVQAPIQIYFWRQWAREVVRQPVAVEESVSLSQAGCEHSIFFPLSPLHLSSRSSHANKHHPADLIKNWSTNRHPAGLVLPSSPRVRRLPAIFGLPTSSNLSRPRTAGKLLEAPGVETQVSIPVWFSLQFLYPFHWCSTRRAFGRLPRF